MIRIWMSWAVERSGCSIILILAAVCSGPTKTLTGPSSNSNTAWPSATNHVTTNRGCLRRALLEDYCWPRHCRNSLNRTTRSDAVISPLVSLTAINRLKSFWRLPFSATVAVF